MRPSLPHPHSLSSLYMVTNKSNVRMDSKSILFERHILLSDPKKNTGPSDSCVHLIKQIKSNKFSFEKELK